MADFNPSFASFPTLEEILTRLSLQQLSLGDKIDALIHTLTLVVTSASPMPSPIPVVPHPHSSSTATIHKLKLDVPRFDGTNPLGWIFKINQFFDYHSTPAHERLTIASFYIEGRALAWFQWMSSNGQLTSWSVFLQALQTYFAQSPYDDPTRALFKLTQKGYVAAYLSEFEELANRVISLPQPFLLSCFISGLSPDIHREMQAMQPLTLVRAAGLARFQVEKVLEHKHAFRTQALSTSAPVTIPLLSPPVRPPPPTMKRLTLDKIASRRERGLCFICDEKYHRGHRCASRVFLFVAEEEDPPPTIIADVDPLPYPLDAPDPNPAQISLNSLSGQVAPETLCFVDLVSNHHIVLLVDGSSTHYFI